MKLFVSPTSPFARKVRVGLIEKNLRAHVEEVVLDPWSSPAELVAANPLSQVPTLVVGPQLVLTGCDSILDYLERHWPELPLWPKDEAARDRAAAIAALAQGMLAFTVDIVLEHRRPEEHRIAAVAERRRAGLERTLDVLGQRFEASTAHFGMGALGVACALGYLDLRLPVLDWRRRRPELADWYTWAVQRASMRATEPPR